MIIELNDPSTKGKYIFDDSGPILVQLFFDQLTGVQWSKKEADTGECPFIPPSIMARWKTVRERALKPTLSLVT